ncbi:FG-GAP-like repeat-containing protein [Streptomyces sp. NPDC017940]|uniref:FG-GAP-like repeat-containing protein n=1 Tax=Streptomyces sp. NPDC017940 TaxID=3365017 RepID=UPI00378BA23B
MGTAVTGTAATGTASARTASTRTAPLGAASTRAASAGAAALRTSAAGPRGVDTPINILNVGSGRCVEVAASSTVDGAPAQQGDCAGHPGARWLIRPSSAGGGAVLLVNAHSGKCLAVETRTVPGRPAGPRVEQWGCAGHPGVNFLLDSREEHAWIRTTLPLAAAPCLEVENAATRSGAPIVLAACEEQKGIAFRQRPDRAGNEVRQDDLNALYGYDDGAVTLFRFAANQAGGFEVSGTPYLSPTGTWDLRESGLTTGDFNGDGYRDTALFKGAADGSAALLTLLGQKDGGYAAPVKTWERPPGNWWGSQTKLTAGDYDGDGRDELAAFYGYSDGSVSLWRFETTAQGGFLSPTVQWSAPKNTWHFDESHFVSGDYNADGRQDVLLFKGTRDGSVTFSTLLGTDGSGFSAPHTSWSRPPGNWWGHEAKLTAGDYDGDGRDEVVAFYGYGDGSVSLWRFAANAQGGFEVPAVVWKAPAGTWTFRHSHIVSGDYDGDGRQDIGLFKGENDGVAALLTLHGKAEGGFGNPLKSWERPPGSWYGDHVKFPGS